MQVPKFNDPNSFWTYHAQNLVLASAALYFARNDALCASTLADTADATAVNLCFSLQNSLRLSSGAQPDPRHLALCLQACVEGLSGSSRFLPEGSLAVPYLSAYADAVSTFNESLWSAAFTPPRKVRISSRPRPKPYSQTIRELLNVTPSEAKKWSKLFLRTLTSSSRQLIAATDEFLQAAAESMEAVEGGARFAQSVRALRGELEMSISPTLPPDLSDQWLDPPDF
jgi:hypothetical protein